MWQTLKDVEKLFQDKLFTKKATRFIVVFVIQFAVLMIIAGTSDLNTENSLLGLVGVSMLFSTILAFLIKTVRIYSKEHPVVEKLWLPIGIIAVGLVVAWAVFVHSFITGGEFGRTLF